MIYLTALRKVISKADSPPLLLEKCAYLPNTPIVNRTIRQSHLEPQQGLSNRKSAHDHKIIDCFNIT